MLYFLLNRYVPPPLRPTGLGSSFVVVLFGLGFFFLFFVRTGGVREEKA